MSSQSKDSEKNQESLGFKGLSRLLAYAKPYRGGFSLAFFLLVIATAFEMATPWLMKIILDDYIATGNYEFNALLMICLVMLAAYIGSASFQYIQEVMFQHQSLKVIHDIRQQVFSHMLRLPIKYFDGEPTGRLVSRLTNDSEVLKQMFVGVLPAILRGGMKIIGIFTALAFLDVHLMLMCLALIPIILGSMKLYQKLSHSVVHGVRARLSDINTHLNESILGMSMIQASNQQGNRLNHFSENNQKWSDLRHKTIGIDSLLLMPFSHLLQTVALAGIVLWFGLQNGNSALEIGTIYAFINYLGRFFEPMRQITMQLSNLQQALVAGERVFNVLDQKQEEQPEVASKHQQVQKGELEFRNVSLSYDNKNQALDNVSFSVKPGQFTAIVGQSGSGKSSIINLMMRFYEHQQGDVLIDGIQLADLDESSLREGLGLVFQEPYIFNGSINENISLGNEAISKQDILAASKKVHADRFISKLSGGYEHQPGASGKGLSTGERQLLSFARTIAQNPKILLLDEATANIDGETEQYIKEALITLREGRTTVAVAHRLSTIQDADEILVMEQGKIVQRGSHEELIVVDGQYRDLYLAQQQEKEMKEPVAA
ncbi:multidrug ABC transporter ATP-binding protein [Endozoicomonas sp. OPT23]|uniref:ABC transporter ATP-binding protein n=1 Tax=Endozoicomonas sp. OPT23 TaxID=2072845 RepID=UPI00129A3C4C|nr:ABC transporter ATP-binding protein [Endozoicomonas sp. OPT23]MRI32761.1 multidrug ABC transporter ATP-binding protein [Endozoicomonas sp. OPT23]